jgi:hypothetical protein
MGSLVQGSLAMKVSSNYKIYFQPEADEPPAQIKSELLFWAAV